jgi:hypothetical protein
MEKTSQVIARGRLQKPHHTGRYLNFKSKHPPHVKRDLLQSLHNRASAICRERQDLFNEISNLRSDLQLNRYPQDFIDSVINSKGSSRPNEGETVSSLCVYPMCEGCFGKF